MKTTIVGILIILGAAINAAVQFLQGQAPDFGVLAAAVTAGIGFITAADHSPAK